MDLDGLLGLAEMNVVEVHPWGGTIDDIERPDVLMFDLDPGEAVLEFRGRNCLSTPPHTCR
jgi:bifunctional non-homologous end joining protein LigD